MSTEAHGASVWRLSWFDTQEKRSPSLEILDNSTFQGEGVTASVYGTWLWRKILIVL